MYYEAHVTLQPVFEEQLKQVKMIAACHEFRVASLIMKKSAEETGDVSRDDTFASARSEDWDDITHRTMAMVHHLKDSGFTVLRYKIEDTMIDSRIRDEWAIL